MNELKEKISDLNSSNADKTAEVESLKTETENLKEEYVLF